MSIIVLIKMLNSKKSGTVYNNKCSKFRKKYRNARNEYLNNESPHINKIWSQNLKHIKRSLNKAVTLTNTMISLTTS